MEKCALMQSQGLDIYPCLKQLEKSDRTLTSETRKADKQSLRMAPAHGPESTQVQPAGLAELR